MREQKVIVLCASLAILISALFPPWLSTWDSSGTREIEGARSQCDLGYHPIFRPPKPRGHGWPAGIKLDTTRLLIEWVCIAAAGCAAWVMTHRTPEKRVDDDTTKSRA